MPHFHFSIGPVQEFVSQARSTNDFWAGSFLLSWLVGVAMCAVRQQGGTIDFPTPPDDYLDWISGKTPPPGHPMARVGAIPNRFAASVAAGFDGTRIEAAVHQAWQALASHTLARDGLDLDKLDVQLACAPGEGSRLLWQRQIVAGCRALWDIQWVIAATGANTGADASAAMHARKRWHTFARTPEPGRKCALMAGWQEMSGLNAYNKVERFWDAARAMAKAHGKVLNVDEREHLCAPAYVKRRFAQHFESFAHDGLLPLKGWPLTIKVPSTIELAEKSTLPGAASGRYYALLLIDGDNLGQHLQRNPRLVATALKIFTDGVNQRITQYDGFLVYAGGDDVFALLPMQHALPCALALRGDYQAAFCRVGEEMGVTMAGAHLPTLSAAIEFAHCKTPLTQLINDSHALLDDVAKAGHGRDSLALRVWKPSGLHLCWGMPWEKALLPQAQPPCLSIEAIANRLQNNPLLFSASFFFRAQAVFASTVGIANADEVNDLLLYEYAHSLASERRKQAFDAASGVPDEANPPELKTRLKQFLTPLYAQSLHTRRITGSNVSNVTSTTNTTTNTTATGSAADATQIHYQHGAPGPDCALLIRFLVQRGWAGREGERA